MSLDALKADANLLRLNEGTLVNTAGSFTNPLGFYTGTNYASDRTAHTPTASDYGTPPGNAPGQSFKTDGSVWVTHDSQSNGGVVVGHTVLCWVKGVALTGGDQGLFCYSNTGDAQGDSYLQVRVNSTGELSLVVRDGSFNDIDSGVTPDWTQWHLVGVSIDSSTSSTLWLDGANAATITRPSSNPGFLRVLALGALARNGTTGNLATAEFYGPWVFDRVLTESEVATIYNAYMSDDSPGIASPVSRSITQPITRSLA